VDGFVYQGALKNVSGAPMTGRQTVQFRLYDAATGGSPLWGRSHSVLLDTNGLFHAELSDGAGDEIEGVNAINLAAILARNSSSPIYVGVTVAGADGEIAPRQRLLSVPYAAFAADSATAAGNFAVAGRLSAAGLAVSGRADIAGKATVKGNAAVKGKLSVSGKILGPGSRAAYGTAPVGAIVIWSGSANRIPDGWKLCDGDNGTPDLRGRFVVGYDDRDSDYNTPGRTGGEKTHTLNLDQLPSHSHNTPVSIWGYHLTRDSLWEFLAPSSYYTDHQTTIPSYSAGGGQAHENRPPYYTLCYIMRVK
jgi:microcystin-dependent protein